MVTAISPSNLFGVSAQCCLSKRTCASKAGKFVIGVKETQRSGCLVVIGTPCLSQLWMRLHPFSSVFSCQCSHFLCVPVAGYPLVGRGAEGVEQLPGGWSHWCGQMTAWCKSRWWCWDCLVLFRGGMGMAQRFSAWLPRDKLLPEQQACAITILAGGPATSIQPQRMYNRIQARAAGKLHTDSTSKKMNTLLKNTSPRNSI